MAKKQQEPASEASNGQTNLIPVKRGIGSGESRKEATININVGSNLSEATEMFGEQIVFDNFVQSCVRNAGNAVAGALKTRTPEEVQTLLADWRPDVKRQRSSTSSALNLTKFDAASEEQQDAWIEELLRRREAARSAASA